MIVFCARPDAGRSSVDPFGYRAAPEMLVSAGEPHMVFEDIVAKQIEQMKYYGLRKLYVKLH